MLAYIMGIKGSKLVKKPKDHKDINLKQITTAGYMFSPPHRRISMRESMALLHRAALKGDWHAAEELLQANRGLIKTSITDGGEIALHIASVEGHTFFVSKLLDNMEPEDIEIQNEKGCTALCFAAAAGHTHIARIMMSRGRPSLPVVKGENGVRPLYMAAQQGFAEMAHFLYRLSDFGSWPENEKIDLLTTAIGSGLYGLAMRIADHHKMLAVAEDSDGETPLLVLARNPSAFHCHNSQGFWVKFMRNVLPYTKSNNQDTNVGCNASTLLDCLWKAIEDICEEDIEAARREDTTRLFFIAAESGHDDFLVELLRRDLNFLYKVNDSKHSVFHIAVLHRYIKVFNLMYELGGTKDLIATYIDTNGNNMLHLAGMLAPQNQLNSIPGAALQMQREVRWYKEIEKLVRPSYKNQKNHDGKTPHEVFLDEHMPLMKEGEKFMKQTAKSCMLVTMLIATVVFTAAFTVPGGYDNKGLPILENKKMFMVFPISEAAATLSSLTSMLMFLSILTSRYSEDDFLTMLPFWLVVGVASLFVSIVAMMVAFCSCLLFFEHGWAAVTLLLFCFGSVPTMFVVVKYPLWVSILRCTYSCTSLFRSYDRLHS